MYTENVAGDPAGMREREICTWGEIWRAGAARLFSGGLISAEVEAGEEQIVDGSGSLQHQLANR